MIKFHHKAYTLVEMMIVVAIIAVILSLALPNYLKTGKASAKNACINNLKQIDGAMEQWAIDKNIEDGITPTAEQEEEIYGYIDGGKPNCPSKGIYTIYAVGSKPQVRCSKDQSEGHKLPE
jgi:prepilin-type N-terminal cleavage/methylation domain-containing protein